MREVIKQPERGDLYWGQMDPAIGAEIQKTRPVVIMSLTPLNRARKTVIVVPLSTSAPAIEFLNVALSNGSVARCEHIRAMDKSRLGQRIGKITTENMNAIEKGLSRIIGLDK